MIVYITNTDDVFFYFSSSSFSFGCFILYRLFVLFFFAAAAAVCYCSDLPITTVHRMILIYFISPVFHISLSDRLFQWFSAVDFFFAIFFPFSMFIRLNSFCFVNVHTLFAYFFRVFTFLHVYRLMFRVHYSFFCSFNGGKSSFCRDFLGFCKKRFMIKII